MRNRKNDRKKKLLPFVTDEQKLLEAVRNSGVTGSPFFSKKKKLGGHSAGSHDQQTRMKKFNKTLANAQLMPDANKYLTRPPTNSKW